MNHWFRKLATVQEWSVVSRGCVPVVLVIILYLQYLGWALFSLSLSDRDHLINAGFLTVQLWTESAILLAALALFSGGLWLRRRQPGAVWFQHLAAHFFSLTLCWGAYLTGTLSFVTGIALMGAPLVGFVLLERRVVPPAFATAFIAMLGLNLGSAYWQLPYAPLLVSPRDSVGALMWVTNELFFAAPLVVINTVLMAVMITRWREREAEIIARSMTDALTGVQNRRSILELLDKEVARTRRHGPPLAVAVIDLDHFRLINDTWGHAVGDRILQAVSGLLEDGIRHCDAIGRFGGEEFMLVLPDTTLEGALILIERCRAEIGSLRVLSDSGEPVPVSASVGLVCNEGHLNLDVPVMLRLADEALYLAKLNGRNRIEHEHLQ